MGRAARRREAARLLGLMMAVRAGNAAKGSDFDKAYKAVERQAEGNE